MRQDRKSYWVKQYPTSPLKEVALYADGLFYLPGRSGGYDAYKLYWISDEPLEEPKNVVTLWDNYYYVIEDDWVQTFAVYFAESDSFLIIGSSRALKPADVKVIAGPYSLTELAVNKPINN